MEKVWGKRGKVHVWIPRIVDNYRDWMCGVDLAEKKISYYHPYFRFHRTWVYIFPVDFHDHIEQLHMLYKSLINMYIPNLLLLTKVFWWRLSGIF